MNVPERSSDQRTEPVNVCQPLDDIEDVERKDEGLRPTDPVRTINTAGTIPQVTVRSHTCPQSSVTTPQC